MRLSCTVIEILSPIFQKLKRSRDSAHDLQVHFVDVGWGLAMINMHTKFVVSSLSRSRNILGGLTI